MKQTVADLSQQIASLQTELNQAKLHEFEAHEANVAIGQVILLYIVVTTFCRLSRLGVQYVSRLISTFFVGENIFNVGVGKQTNEKHLLS